MAEPTNVRVRSRSANSKSGSAIAASGRRNACTSSPSGHSRRDARQARPETRMCPGPVEHWGLQAFGDTPSQAPYHSSSIAMPDGSLRAADNLQTFQRAAALFRNSRGFVQVALVITFSSSAFVFVMVRGAGSRPSIAGRRTVAGGKIWSARTVMEAPGGSTVTDFHRAQIFTGARLQHPSPQNPSVSSADGPYINGTGASFSRR